MKFISALRCSIQKQLQIFDQRLYVSAHALEQVCFVIAVPFLTQTSRSVNLMGFISDSISFLHEFQEKSW